MNVIFAAIQFWFLIDSILKVYFQVAKKFSEFARVRPKHRLSYVFPTQLITLAAHYPLSPNGHSDDIYHVLLCHSVVYPLKSFLRSSIVLVSRNYGLNYYQTPRWIPLRQLLTIVLVK